MTRPKPKIPDDPKAVFTQAFKNLDGIAGLTAWGKSHRTLFYGYYAKMINASSPVQVDVNNNLNVRIESDKTRAALEAAFARIVDARGTGDKAGVVIDARANRETVPQLSQTEAEPLLSPAAEQTAAQAEQHQPDDVVKLKPFHPGAPPRELSSTEKYIEWIANKRDQWSNNT
jgi:hypothetical protein